jgi:long-chain fatty acid transport protein
MQTPRSSSVVVAFLASAGAVAIPAVAQAGGFTVARFGGDHGNVATDNPTALYFNPAGLADRDPDDPDKKFELHVFLDASFALRYLSWDHAAAPSDVPDPMGAAGANTGKATLLNFVTSPMAAVNFKIKDFAIGAGFCVPFGGQESWNQNSKFANSTMFPGPVDGIQRWSVINGTITSDYIMLGAAYDIADRVAIGASLNVIRTDVNTVRARTTDGTNDTANEGRSLLTVGGWNGAFGVGILGEVVPHKLWIGASYQSEPGVAGGMRLKGTLQNNFAGVKTNDPVQLFQEMPAIYRFGLRAKPADKWEIRFNAQVEDWSVFKNQCIAVASATTCTTNPDGTAPTTENPPPIQNIPRNWGPSFGTRFGGSYWVSDPVEIFASLGFDSNAIPSSTLEPTFTDFNSFSPSFGAKFGIGKHVKLAGSYTHYIAIPRDTTGESTLAKLQPPSRTPDAGGQYNQVLGVLNVNAELSF